MGRWRTQNIKPANAEGQLYCVILYQGLEHHWILASVGFLGPIPCGYQGMTLYPKCPLSALLAHPPISASYHLSVMNTVIHLSVFGNKTNSLVLSVPV